MERGARLTSVRGPASDRRSLSHPKERSENEGRQCLADNDHRPRYKQMVVIVRTFPVAVEDLADRSRLPALDELRPRSCPSCGHPARSPGAPMGIVGNGTYRRQVLGVVAATESLVILVRRFLCRGCDVSISVLPDALLPRRWYAGTVMLLALALSLLRGQSASEVRRGLRHRGEAHGWKTLDRWQRQLLAPLWNWVAAQIGFEDCGPGADRVQRSTRLRRLLLLRGVHARSPDADIEQAACALAMNTTHTQAESWQIHRVR